MRLSQLTIQNFRNIPLAELEFQGLRHFFTGANGEGKTNLLEAIGFVTALRSFRTSERAPLIRWGESSASIRYDIDHESRKESVVRLDLLANRTDAQLDGEKLTRYADLVGLFPTVCFSSQDIQLLRGTPALRRRFIDLTFSAGDATYYQHLRRYHQTLTERNALLKQGAAPSVLTAFEHTLADVGAPLIALRQDGMNRLQMTLASVYKCFCPESESPMLNYKCDLPLTSAEALHAHWQNQRPRDLALQTTSRGPHRDDFMLNLCGRDARDAASEGQQRSLVLALRFAQAAWLEQCTGIKPALLLDDILGELDPPRRSAFWASVDTGAQVFATGTSNPTDETGWTRWTVQHGTFARTE
ncbi:MAG: DNA replication/repair protein RecF [Verrucomicrobiota bacterium]|nr:DNA replication/repair protein RecF [Verrucomicrobiota bacterium]